jgi:hypothetical protein
LFLFFFRNFLFDFDHILILWYRVFLKHGTTKIKKKKFYP